MAASFKMSTHFPSFSRVFGKLEHVENLDLVELYPDYENSKSKYGRGSSNDWSNEPFTTESKAPGGTSGRRHLGGTHRSKGTGKRSGGSRRGRGRNDKCRSRLFEGVGVGAGMSEKCKN